MSLPTSGMFCVGNPLQLICAHEASEAYGIQESTLIVRDVSKKRMRHRTQVERLLEMQKWDDVIIWPYSRGPVALRLLWSASFAKNIRKLKNKTDFLFIGGFGQFGNHVLRSVIDAEKVVLLDEGSSTIDWYYKYLRHGIYVPGVVAHFLYAKSGKARFARWLTSLHKANLEKPIEIFTVFDLAKLAAAVGISIRRNEFAHLKASARKYKVDNDSAVFIGSPLSENGKLEQSYELFLINEAVKALGRMGTNVRYLAHRNESVEKLEQIRNSGVWIEFTDEPIEMHFVRNVSVPGMFLGIGSTALYSLKTIFPHCRVIFLDPSEGTSQERTMALERHITIYRAGGVEVVTSFGSEFG